MIFTETNFALFLSTVLAIYWAIRRKSFQNVLLLVASYIFYGFVHPWFCLLLGFVTAVNFVCGIQMEKRPSRRKGLLVVAAVLSLGQLAFFKYFDFFASNVGKMLAFAGLDPGNLTLGILLPVGISFYTFQTLGYTVDVYRGRMKPIRSAVDFSLYVSFFPQLVAGPIERSTQLLPQIEQRRTFSLTLIEEAWPLMVTGYLKKMVIADNVSVYVDKIFMLKSPSLSLLIVGSFAFAIQIYADFSAYTDIARGTARLFGFQLMKNFNFPYLALSPSDFWNRWHISFSSWIRDYLYIPLGGSRRPSRLGYVYVIFVSMGLSGLWHGAAWNFVVWGLYHGALILGYRLLGYYGKWRPSGVPATAAAWAVMFSFTLFGWCLFRTPDVSMIVESIAAPDWGLHGAPLLSALYVLLLTCVYAIPLVIIDTIALFNVKNRWLHAAVNSAAVIAILLLHRDSGGDFIYFQF